MRAAAALLLGLFATGCAAAGRQVVETALAPRPIGPYSQAVRAGDLLWCAGQIGLDPATGELAPGGVAAQTRRALENLDAVLRAAGFRRADVVAAQVLLIDLAHFQEFNQIYAEFLGPVAKPARTTAQVAALPRGAAVEITFVAARPR